MKRKICAITGSRAEYGLIQPALKALEENPEFELLLIACGTHLSKDYGSTIEEIEKDGFEIMAKIQSTPLTDTGAAMANSVGLITQELSKIMLKNRPDIIIGLTDLGHALAAAILGVYMNIPVAHIHGGDVSGTADESIRHAITKLSHIHFPATEKSAERIIKMGEDPCRVFVVGAPGLDSILNEDLLSQDEIAKRYDLDRGVPFIIMIQHPVTTEVDEAGFQIKETLDALVELGINTVLIYPNSDAGGRRMIKMIEEYGEKYPFIKAYKSLPHIEYISLMKYASVMVGNSSSGIIEAPSFQLPVVNIGSRQEGRERAENVINVSYDKKDIIAAVNRALHDKDFRREVDNCKNPYGDGKASERIVKVLSKIEIDKKLIQKRLRY